MADDKWKLKPHPTISTPSREHPLLVCVLDGWGEAPDAEDNAIFRVRSQAEACHLARHPSQPHSCRSRSGCVPQQVCSIHVLHITLTLFR